MNNNEIQFFINHIDSVINNKDNVDSKFVRHHLGIGMPEATGIFRVINASTLLELIEFYFNDSKDKNV